MQTPVNIIKNNRLQLSNPISAIIFILSSLNALSAGQATMGIFEQHGDVGARNLEGNLEYHPGKQVYYLEGSGENIWSDQDQFHFT